MKKILSIFLPVLIALNINAQNITIKINGGENLSGTSLQNAIDTNALSSIEHLEVNAGYFSTADWTYLKLHHNEFTSMTHFTVTETVDSVADIPNTTYSGSYFKRNKIEHISIAKLKKTGEYALYFCENLKTLDLPDLKYVASVSFARCKSLRSIILPKVTSLGISVFAYCHALKTVTLPQLNHVPVPSHTFKQCYSLYELKLGVTPPPVSMLSFAHGGATGHFVSFVDENGNYLPDTSYQTAFNNYKSVDDGDTTDNKWFGWNLLQQGNVSVSVNDAPEVYSGMHLNAALQNWGGNLSDITSLEINGGYISFFDWIYLRYHRNDFSSMTHFTVTETVDSVADIPNASYQALGYNKASLYFKKNKIKHISIAKLEEIGSRAFYNCDSLETVNFPDALSLGEYSFFDCDALSSVNFPELDSLGKGAFRSCDTLIYVSFPNVTNVGEQAFYLCKSLTSVSFPNATNVAPKSFENCFSLTEINFPQATQIQMSAFKNCTTLVSLNLPQVTIISPEAFRYCKSLKSLNLPLTTNIYSHAFTSCSALQTIHLPELNHLGKWGFAGCGSLKSVYLPKLTSIDKSGFASCISLFSVSLPKVTSMGKWAFSNNYSLYIMKLSSTPPTLGDDCFAYSQSPRHLMWIDDDYNLLADSAYEVALDNYQSVNDGDTTDNVWHGWTLSSPYLQMSVNGDTTVYTGANLQVALENWGGNLSEINTIEINGGNVNNTDWEYLKEHHNEFTAMTDFTITNDIDIVLNMPDISSSDAVNGLAYFKRDKIKNISLAKLKRIGDYGFYECNNLTSVTLPKVTHIRDSAFYNCNLLDSIKLGVNPPGVIDSSVFEGCANLRYLGFVNEDVQAPTPLECHEGFYDYRTVDDGNNQDHKWYGWILPDVSPLTISVNGDTSIYSGSNLAGALSDWGGNFSDITHLEINGGSFITADWMYLRNHHNEFTQMTDFSITNAIEGVANVPNIYSQQFAYFKRDVIQNVSIAKIKRIGNAAFFNCNALVTVDFPDVVSVGEYAFCFCNHLSNMNIPLLTYVEKNGFRGCGSLSSQTFSRLTAISGEAFKGCSALYELKLGVNPPVVAGSAFHFLSSPRFVSFVDENGNALTDAAYQEALANYKQVDDGDTTDNKWYGWHLTSSGTCTIALNEDTTSYTGNGLGDALSVWGGNLSDITHLKIKGGVVRELDWVYLKNHREDLSEMTHFTVTNEVDTVENMPNLPNGQSYFKSDKIKNISIAKLQKIGNRAFYHSQTLKTINFPQVTEIGKYVFEQCTALDTIAFPQVTQIGNAAFQGCTNLRVASFPRLTDIGDDTFLGNSLLSILRLGAIPPTIGSSSFLFTSDPRYIEFIDEEGELLSGLEKQTAVANYKSVADGDTTDNRWYVWRFLDLQNIVIALNGDTTSYSGNGLFDALSEWGGDYSDITHLTVKGGTLTDLDWAYLRSCRNMFTAMTDFTVTESVDSVYNIPGAAQPCFKQDKIQNISIAKVQEIGYRAFYDCDILTVVNLPNAKALGNQVFKNCSALTTVEVPNLITIGQNTFKNCSSLALVHLPSATSIGDYAFRECSALTTVEAPNLITIGQESFKNCSSLALVHLPNVTSIGNYAFNKCSALETFDIPNLTDMGGGSFANCNALVSVVLPIVNNIPNGTFLNCTSLTTVNAPLVNSIGHSAFEGCSSLNNVNLPEAISLGGQAFKNCSALISLDLPNITELGYEAFINCNALTSLSLPKATEISSWAFEACSSFSELKLGGTPPNIGIYPFLNCPGTRHLKFVNENGDELSGAELNNVILTYKAVDDGNINDHKWHGWILPEFNLLSISVNGNTTTYTGYNLQNALESWGGNLSELSHLEINGGSVSTEDWNYLKEHHNDFIAMTHFTVTNALDSVSEIPSINGNETYFKQDKIRSINIAKVQSIGEKLFKGCDSLKVVSFPDAINIGKQAFSNCNSLDSVNCSQVSHIGDEAFVGCNALTVINTNQVVEVGLFAFKNCHSLAALNFPELSSIGEGAFMNCSALLEVDFPNVIVINQEAFKDCSALHHVNFANVLSLKDKAFQNCGALVSSDFPNVLSISNSAFENCSSLTEVIMPVLTDIGSYALKNCSALHHVNFPQLVNMASGVFEGCTSLESVNLQSLVTLPDAEFANCTSLTTINIPEVESVGERAFEHCTSLESIDLPLVTTINSEAFFGCTSLTTVNLPEVTDVGEKAFRGCVSLVSLSLPEALNIYDRAFYSCVALEEIDLPKVTHLSDEIFYLCSSLQEINFPELKTLGYGVFGYCDLLTTVNLPEVIDVGNTAFYHCESLTTVNMPKLTYIGEAVFLECSSLVTAHFPEVSAIGYGAFTSCSALESLSFPKLTNIEAYFSWHCDNLSELKLGMTPPIIGFDGQNWTSLPAYRHLVFLNEDGTDLSPSDYQIAISNYKSEQDGDTTDYKWYGWFMLSAPTVNTLVNYEYGDETTSLTAIASESCTLHWYMQETGGEELPSAPTPSTNMAGTWSYWVSQTNDTTNLESGRVEIRVIVDKKEITVTPDKDQNKKQGEEDPVLTYTFTPELIGSDTLTGALSREPGEEVGTYAIKQGTLSGGDNYEIVFVDDVLFEITSASDIDSIIEEPSFVLYPNPAKDYVKIDLGDNYSQVKSMFIVDGLGKKVLNIESFDRGVLSLPVQELSAGVYWVNILTNNKRVVLELVVL